MTPLEDARRQWDDAGLPFPFVPADLAPAFHRLGDWSFGTLDDLPPAPALDQHVRETLPGDHPDAALLAHAGHGVASWAVHWYLWIGPVAIFVQSQWGNADAAADEDAEQRRRMSRRFAAAEALTRAALAAPAASTRLVVIASDFRPSGWGVVEPGVPLRWTDADEPFAEAEAWLHT